MSDEAEDSGPQEPSGDNRRDLEDSHSSGSSIETSPRRCQRRNRALIVADSDSESSIETQARKRRRIPRVQSDDDSSGSSGSPIVRTSKGPPRLLSDHSEDSGSDDGFQGSSSSDWETDNSDTETAEPKKPAQDTGLDSDSSDGQSEKCPICLKSFSTQEVGVPENCEHTFCSECLQEWAKTMNTCPVDRQEFTQISIRRHLNGKTVRQIPVQPPQPPNELNIIEDLTFCEICGSGDREDRMLLCDGCDLGFHMDCLDPPLLNIPLGPWYCRRCSVGHLLNIDFEQNFQYRYDVRDMGLASAARQWRLVPRTPQNERVRRRIANNRNQTQNAPVSSTSNTTRRKKKKKPRKKRRAYRKTYKIDEATGETIEIKILIKQRKGRKKAKKLKKLIPKTPKGRLAQQLGMCAPRSIPQSLPDVRTQANTSENLGHRRFQAGIPALHIFGPRNEILEGFSDDEYEAGGSGILTRRAPNMQDVAILRRARAKTRINLSHDVVSSSSDLLSEIMDSQTKFHGKNSKISLLKDGRVAAEKKEGGKVDVKNYKASVRQKPANYSNHDVPSSSASSYAEDQRQQEGTNNSNSSMPSSTVTSAPNTGVNNSNQESSQQGEFLGQAHFEFCDFAEDKAKEKRQPEGNTNSNSAMPSSTFTSAENSDVNNMNQESQPGEFSGQPSFQYSDFPEDKTKEERQPEGTSLMPSSTVTSAENTAPNNVNQEGDFQHCDFPDDKPKEKKPESRSQTPGSDSDVDIYSDIETETVTTSKVDEADLKMSSQQTSITEDDDGNDSDLDMVIDTEKAEPEPEPETVSSSTVNNPDSNVNVQAVTSTSDILESSSTHPLFPEDEVVKDDDDDSTDGCPNFSIYSKESITMAKNTDVTLDNSEEVVPKEAPTPSDETTNQVEEISSSPALVETPQPRVIKHKTSTSTGGGGLYSDSEDESVVKKGIENAFGITDIANMTEDISEEERSYTPCLDERPVMKEGLDGLDTEMVSDEDRNDFDETHELKTAVSDAGDALEINAKESELDFTRPEEYEEGEIVDKLKGNKTQSTTPEDSSGPETENKAPPKNPDIGNQDNTTSNNPIETPLKDQEITNNNNITNSNNKENEKSNNNTETFKKLSRSNKERNYRDKEKDREKTSRSRSPEKRKDKEKVKRGRKRDKRKEIERYDVRAIIGDKPRSARRIKDQFGRDIRHSATRSRSKTPQTPPVNRRSRSRRRSISRPRRSRSRSVAKKRRRSRRSLSKSRSRSRSRPKKRRTSTSRDRRRNRSVEKRKRKRRTRTRSRSSTISPLKRLREHARKTERTREYTPSLSRSRSRSQDMRRFTPPWTPPRVMDSVVKPHNRLTVILTNDKSKKKDKKKRSDKKTREAEKKKKKQKRDSNRTPPPSKEVFASGDNILVSVSFNKENETTSRDISTRRKRDALASEEANKNKKSQERRVKSRLSRRLPGKDLSGVKPVAIIDLAMSPFKELTPSPQDVIILTDSDTEETRRNEGGDKNVACDSSSAQVTSPERLANYSSGPKTPPEPQVKFILAPKPAQMRNISNPLHEPDENAEAENTNEADTDDGHKGPNTPPEPPNSPPSSPDAYDPFEPTKSRSATPDESAGLQSNPVTVDNSLEATKENPVDARDQLTLTPDALKTPPLADIQPADSQSSIQVTPESSGKSPTDRGSGGSAGALISQSSQTPTLKATAQTIPFSSPAPTSNITSTPVSSLPRINILNTTILAPTSSNIPQRIVLPSPVKISPNKNQNPVKSAPIKPMPVNNNNNKSTGRTKSQNGSNEAPVENISLDSPYSPGSSDYEDLFEPPTENSAPAVTKPSPAKTANKTAKSPAKIQNTFDALFGSPFNKNLKAKSGAENNSSAKPAAKYLPQKKSGAALTPGKTKQKGIKVDEDTLKILDDLPNSAVEMQVKDKFLKKLNRQERVVEEVKLVLKPHYNKKHINKEEYKDILRRAVPKICHNKSGEINPTKIKNLIEAYVKKVRHSKKVTSSSSVKA